LWLALGVLRIYVVLMLAVAIRVNLFKARLSQPSSLIRIISVSGAGTRRFGPSEWQLLERRLGEWKKAVADARAVIEEAEQVAAQGPITHQRRPGGGRRDGRDGRDGRDARDGRDGRDGREGREREERDKGREGEEVAA
jgi:translation initiation factor 3 subunit M